MRKDGSFPPKKMVTAWGVFPLLLLSVTATSLTPTPSPTECNGEHDLIRFITYWDCFVSLRFLSFRFVWMIRG